MNMCYQLTKNEKGGWHYTLTISNTTLKGWRKGTKFDVEHYIKRASQNCEIRAREKQSPMSKLNRKIEITERIEF